MSSVVFRYHLRPSAFQITSRVKLMQEVTSSDAQRCFKIGKFVAQTSLSYTGIIRFALITRFIRLGKFSRNINKICQKKRS